MISYDSLPESAHDLMVFVAANVLKRPIVVMAASPDDNRLFLPLRHTTQVCPPHDLAGWPSPMRALTPVRLPPRQEPPLLLQRGWSEQPGSAPFMSYWPVLHYPREAYWRWATGLFHGKDAAIAALRCAQKSLHSATFSCAASEAEAILTGRTSASGTGLTGGSRSGWRRFAVGALSPVHRCRRCWGLRELALCDSVRDQCGRERAEEDTCGVGGVGGSDRSGGGGVWRSASHEPDPDRMGCDR
jgi:hypothetical protein